MALEFYFEPYRVVANIMIIFEIQPYRDSIEAHGINRLCLGFVLLCYRAQAFRLEPRP